jgi:hypothetical protein
VFLPKSSLITHLPADHSHFPSSLWPGSIGPTRYDSQYIVQIPPWHEGASSALLVMPGRLVFHCSVPASC